jgi:mRNA interferase MazF
MRRGEVWTVSGGAGYASKPRPGVIIQDDSFAGTASVTYCPLTTYEVDAPYFRIMVDPEDMNGLLLRSYVMADKVTTLPRERFGERIGMLSPDDRASVDQALLLFLGLLVG